MRDGSAPFFLRFVTGWKSWRNIHCDSGRGRDADRSAPPPHRAVLARLTHTVLTSDTWRQSVQWDTGVGHRQPGAGFRVAPGTCSRTSSASGSVDESDAATSEARGSEIAPGFFHCQEQRGTGNILGPPTVGIWPSPPEGHAVAFSAQLNLLQLRCSTLADRLSDYGEIACRPVRPANMGETQEIKGLRTSLSPLFPSLGGVTSRLTAEATAVAGRTHCRSARPVHSCHSRGL
jgi:hypothetical protein